MTTREKTAGISTGLNLGLTTAKFILYYFTGSMAILAEAWHSFSDIGTSLLVYLAVRFQKKEDKKSSQLSEEKASLFGREANSVSPGTLPKRPLLQSDFARSIRCFDDDTKFHHI